jgi:nucleoside-diphosphate-sugar epimerase
METNIAHIERTQPAVTLASELPELERHYRDKRVLITGGLGFLGSSLACTLAAWGADITLVDSLQPLYGGNRFNVHDVESELCTIVADLRDANVIRRAVQDTDVIFHLAAQVSYIDSLSMPMEDLALNAGLTLQILEEVRRLPDKSKPKVVFASSRMVVGRVDGPMLTEETRPQPLSLYGVHKLASERYLAIYHQNFGIPTLALRITNPYGPRQQIHHSKYSMVGWFIRQALENQTIRIFGDGEQRRDYVYIDDLAEAFLRCAAAEQAVGMVVNVGSGVVTRFRDMVRTVLDVVGSGRLEFVPWPKDYERLETGDVVTDISRLHRLTGWRSRVDLRTGVALTTDYYRRHWDHYVREAQQPRAAVG